MASEEKGIGTGDPTQAPGWNELGFVPWNSFRRMAPSILTLEVTRLGELIGGAVEIEFRNALVKTRYELGLFVDSLSTGNGRAAGFDTVHLQAAILNLPLDYPGIDAKTVETLTYILDRLQYVHNRIRFVYQ